MSKIGAHVSIAGGIINAPLNAAERQCESFQMFTRSPRGGKAQLLTKNIIKDFLDNCDKNEISNYYIHTPYYINYASAKQRIYKGSIEVVRQELERGTKIKAKALMTHLGSSKDFGKSKGLKKVIQGIRETMKGYTGTTQFLLENSAGAGGTIIGSTFEELGKIIKALPKYNLGVCLDTCHAFSSGYDIRDKVSVNKTLKEFNKHIGLSKLVLIHANDSKTEFGSNKDRHEHIGKGKIGIKGFTALMSHPALKKVDFILETPDDNLGKIDLNKLKKIRNNR
ncbi:MAG: deoxyribonuclease IV [Candidatus Kerfeldbacteria bacterium]